MVRYLIAASILLVASVASVRCDTGLAQAKPWSVEIVPFSKEMGLVSLQDQEGNVVVSVGTPVPDGVMTPGGFIPEMLKADPPKRLAERDVQVWVLRHVGTALAPTAPPTVPGPTAGSGGWTMEMMDFRFENAQRSELAGVVVSADGKLSVREIPPADESGQRKPAP